MHECIYMCVCGFQKTFIQTLIFHPHHHANLLGTFNVTWVKRYVRLKQSYLNVFEGEQRTGKAEQVKERLNPSGLTSFVTYPLHI